MNTTRIKHWQRNYRLREPHVDAWERLASGGVLVAFEKAISKVISNEREVVLLRSVALRFTAPKPVGSHSDLAEQWGLAMATAVQEALRRNDSGNVQRFADVEEQIVCFLEAVVTERHQDAWYFARLRDLENELGETDARSGNVGRFDSLLKQHIYDWPELLARLSQRGLAIPVLRRVSPAVQQRLWSEGIRGIDSPRDRESERPLFQAALQIVARLCGRDLTSTESESAFQAYSSRPQPETDWSDIAHLAESVFAAVRFLLDRRSVLLESTTERAVELSRQIKLATESLDWLDRDWLRRRLIRYVSQDLHTVSSSIGTQSPIPIQAAWERSWRSIESQFLAEWNSENGASASNCLLAMSMMARQHSEWVHNPAIATFIERKLAQIDRECRSSRLLSLPDKNQSGFPATDTAHLANGELREGADDDVVVIREVLAPDRTTFRTKYAGAFLLARGLHDLRIPSIARRTGFPSRSPWAASKLLMEMACYWNQRDCPSEVDYGLLEFARLAGSAEWTELATETDAADESTTLDFQTNLALAMINLRTWTVPSQLHVMVTHNDPNEVWLIGGDAEGRVYPWAAPAANTAQAQRTIELWQSKLCEWSEQPVSVILDESTRLLDEFPDVAFTPVQGRSTSWMPTGWVVERLRERTTHAAAAGILRHWARGLRGFATASDEFLLQQLIRRSGTVEVQPGQIMIVMETRPLDPVLQLSGMMESLDFFDGKGLIKISVKTLS